MEKNVFLEGYWVTNLGDDLFVKIICERYPKSNFFIESEIEHKKVFKEIKNLTAYDKNYNLIYKIKQKFFHKYFKNSIFFKYYHKIPIYVEIGGSIFMMPTNIKEKRAINKRKNVRKIASKYLIIGSNFGPFYFDEQLKEYSGFFETLDGIVFRDRYSKNLFKGNNIQVASDVVFNLDIDKYISKNKSNNVIISIIDVFQKNRKINKESLYYEDYLINNIVNLIEQGNQITLMSFCEKEGDVIAAKRILSKVPALYQDKVNIYNHSDIEDSLVLLGEASKIIATRFHAMILGWLLKKPTFVISYSDKTINVIDDIYPEQSYIQIDKIPLKEKNIGEGNFTVITEEKLKNAINSSRKQFQFLDEILLEQKNNFEI